VEDAPLLFTSLAPATSLITLNCDIGDRGVVVHRNCDCLYDKLNCRQTIRTIRSSDKLTELGVTIWVSDVHDVLENTLAKRYSSAPGDFQLVETRTPAGLPRYLLLLHPRVGAVAQDTVAALFLEELGRRKSYYSFMTAIWRREGVLSVHRHPPLHTSRGKALPFQRVQDPSLLPDALREYITSA
jgi:hypothetical protein